MSDYHSYDNRTPPNFAEQVVNSIELWILAKGEEPKSPGYVGLRNQVILETVAGLVSLISDVDDRQVLQAALDQIKSQHSRLN